MMKDIMTYVLFAEDAGAPELRNPYNRDPRAGKGWLAKLVNRNR